MDAEERANAIPIVQERRDELAAREGVPEVRLFDTTVIRAAGQVVFADPHEQGTVVALWRQLSGDAHSLLWANLTRASTTRTRSARDPRYPMPMAELRAGADLAELVSDFWATYRILKVGWSLFDQRCTAP